MTYKTYQSSKHRIDIKIEIFFTDSNCKLFSAVVSQHWEPNSAASLYEGLTSYECYSSWHKRNDISGKSDVTSAPQIHKGVENYRSIDGFYCMKTSAFMYHSRKSNEVGWLQLDLKGYFSLKCIRITVRESDALIQKLGIRFGNESKVEDFEKNPIIIAETENGLERIIFEYCLERHLIGRYLLLQEKKSEIDYIIIGEIQVIVE